MSRVKKMWGIVIFVALAIVGIGFADHDENRKHGKHEKGHHSDEKRSSSKHNEEDYLKPVSNTVYKEQCGACHFAYQPELLSSEGWKKILAQPDKHFGQSVDLNTKTKRVITAYLETNAAEKSGTEISRKIIKKSG